MRLATIDVGTNTALLLVSEWHDGHLNVLHDGGGYVRLGEGLGASGRVSPQALERLRSVLRAHQATARTWSVDHMIVTGTSASRDAENGDDICAVVYEETGANYRILTGPEEAVVTFEGALFGWQVEGGYEGRVTVIDVGGGSTEIVQGCCSDGRADLKAAVSLDLGTVRLTEKFYSVQPPQDNEVAGCRMWIASRMGPAIADYAHGVPLVGSSGTAQVLFHLQHRHRGPSDVMTGDDLAYWEHELHSRKKEEIRVLAPGRMAGRADVFPSGVMVIREAFLALAASGFHVSEFGVRHGVALRYFRKLASV